MFYTVKNGLSDVSQRMIQRTVTELDAKVCFVEIPSEIMKEFEQFDITVSHITCAAFYRLALPYLIDSAVGRMIYMDCDIMVRGDVEAFYSMKLKGNILAGVPDNNYKILADRLGLKNYINSGVLLVDLAKWRERYTIEQLIDEIKHAYLDKELIHGDQDLINLLFTESILLVDDIYNYQKHIHKYYTFRHKKERDCAIIIHFITAKKPWCGDYCYPYTREYYKYLKQYLSVKEKIKYWVMKPLGVYRLIKTEIIAKRREAELGE